MDLIDLIKTGLASLIQGLTKKTDACGELFQVIVFSQRHSLGVLAGGHLPEGPCEAIFRARDSVGDQDGLQKDHEGDEHTQQ
jgi:hypothetical protein